MDYWTFAVLFVAGVVAETFLTFSRPVLERRPNALFWNNAFVLALVAMAVAAFFMYGFLRGILTLALGFGAFLVRSVMHNRSAERQLFEHIGKAPRK